ncbi:MAG: DUF3375 domain-containing protein [Salinisphaera sp.]|nr:DUF3375 domain-containing protein [Salinisphaera sp.]
MDYDHLSALRGSHPAWRLLAADHAPLIVAFIHRAFTQPNLRTLAEQEAATQLDGYLFHLRETLGEDAFPKRALDYLNEWAADERGWLRKYYRQDSDEPHFDITPATERAVQWLAGLEQQTFVGTESRLKTIFDLLHQIAHGTETDPEARIADLEARKARIDDEIERIRDGEMTFLDDTQLRERFQQMADIARALLADFRQVEQNFRDLDRDLRQRIAQWQGSRGALLEEVLGERDAISDSDQGRSFQAFWDFLMSPARQDELSSLLQQTLALEPIAALAPDRRLAQVHYDWLEAGDVAQRTVARLSAQLRRYLDDQAWLENRRIMELIRGIEQRAMTLRENPPRELDLGVDAPAPAIALPMERRLFSPPIKPKIEQQVLLEGESQTDADPMFDQIHVDRARLDGHIRRALQTRDQITLAALLDEHPLEQGLAELVTWLSIAAEDGHAVIDDDSPQTVAWCSDDGQLRQATLPTVVFVRQAVAAGT